MNSFSPRHYSVSNINDSNNISNNNNSDKNVEKTSHSHSRQRLYYNNEYDLITTIKSRTLLGWPTDTFEMDYVAAALNNNKNSNNHVHTILVFTPGNPGLIEWYLDFFVQIMQRLGPGYAVRGVANASHSLDRNKVAVVADDSSSKNNRNIPWTVDGQAFHKIAYYDQALSWDAADAALFLSSTDQASIIRPGIIWISHSIGCHFCQRMCVLRRDILQRTLAFINLMPFVRMQAGPQLWHKQVLCDMAAAYPEWLIKASQVTIQHGLSRLPIQTVDWILSCTGVMTKDNNGRHVTAQLVRMPEFARNFFALGTEEIRDVPEQVDVAGLRYLTNSCYGDGGASIYYLLAGNDHWSPSFHMQDWQRLQTLGVLSQGGGGGGGGGNINWTQIPQLQHDFVSDYQTQVPIVVDYCCNIIIQKEGRNIDACSRRDNKLDQLPPLARTPSLPRSKL